MRRAFAVRVHVAHRDSAVLREQHYDVAVGLHSDISRSLDALYEGAPAILPRSAERNEIITAI